MTIRLYQDYAKAYNVAAAAFVGGGGALDANRTTPIEINS